MPTPLEDALASLCDHPCERLVPSDVVADRTEYDDACTSQLLGALDADARAALRLVEHAQQTALERARAGEADAAWTLLETARGILGELALDPIAARATRSASLLAESFLWFERGNKERMQTCLDTAIALDTEVFEMGADVIVVHRLQVAFALVRALLREQLDATTAALAAQLIDHAEGDESAWPGRTGTVRVRSARSAAWCTALIVPVVADLAECSAGDAGRARIIIDPLATHIAGDGPDCHGAVAEHLWMRATRRLVDGDRDGFLALVPPAIEAAADGHPVVWQALALDVWNLARVERTPDDPMLRVLRTSTNDFADFRPALRARLA